MRPEEHIAAGKSINDVLTAFREGVNQLGTPRAVGQCLVLNLDHIQQLLSEPVTEEEAQALLDVLYKRRWMEELIRWLSDRPVTWEDFPTYEANLREEAKRKWAEDRERHRGVELFPNRRFPAISDFCPDCCSSEWKPIIYGHDGRRCRGSEAWGICAGRLHYGGREPVLHRLLQPLADQTGYEQTWGHARSDPTSHRSEPG